MIGEVFITSSGYDPALGKHVKDPYLGDIPSLGICRPDIRRRINPGDFIFLVSGKVKNAPQYVVGGFEVDRKVDANTAYQLFPEQRLHLLEDGQLNGNIIVDVNGNQHPLDQHESFNRRVDNFVIGKEAIALVTPDEVAQGRAETLNVLQEIIGKRGNSLINVVGRWGTRLDGEQALKVRDWLLSIKQRSRASSAGN